MPDTRRRSCKRNNKQYGGGLGGVVNSTPASFGHLVNNPLSWSAGSSCLAEPRPGMISGYTPHGLPGMSQAGGSRRKGRAGKRSGSKRSGSKRSGSKRSGRKAKGTRKQRGGAYGFTGGAGIVSGYPGGASYAPMTPIGCTGSSGSEIPDSGAADSLNRTGGPLWDGPKTSALQRGGAYELGETLKTAGYSSLVPGANGVIPTAAGTLLSVNVPTDGRIAGGACGVYPQKGGRKNRKDSRKNRKDSRKNRKDSRKNHKDSRKNSRKNRKDRR
jgi:hypothetical protein